MNKQRRDILLEEWGKFSLDTAKLIIGGVILAGIMRTDVSPEYLIIYGTLFVALFFGIGTVFPSSKEPKSIAYVNRIVYILGTCGANVDFIGVYSDSFADIR